MKPSLPVLSFVLSAFFCPMPLLRAAVPPGRQWETRRSETTRSDLAGVAVNPNDGKILTVGGGGAIRVSTDGGATWSGESAGSHAKLSGVAWGGDQWVAVGGEGGGGLILTSPHGLHWSHCCRGAASGFSGVASNASVTVAACGQNGEAAWSGDLETWHLADTGCTDYLKDIVWNGERFLVVSWTGAIESSPDGAEWTELHSSSAGYYERFVSLASNGHVTVAAGIDYQSGAPGAEVPLMRALTEGGDWVKLALPSLGDAEMIEKIRWVPGPESDPEAGMFVAAADNEKVLVSTDGLDWRQIDVHDRPEGDYGVSGIIRNPAGGLLFVGEGGMVLVSDDTMASWTVRVAPEPASRYVGIAEGRLSGGARRTVLVADNHGALLTSDDDCVSFIAHGSASYNAVAATTVASRVFLVVGENGYLFSSSDGIGWTSESTGTTEDLKDIAWFLPQGAVAPFGVACGSGGTVLVSDSDATNWTLHTLTAEGGYHPYLSAVACKAIEWDFNGFPLVTNTVVVAGGSTIFVSIDNGKTWTQKDSGLGSGQDVVAMTDWKDGFVALVKGGGVILSADGSTWTKPDCEFDGPTPYFSEPSDIAWTGAELVATARNDGIYTSSDAIHWTRRHAPVDSGMCAVTELNSGRLVAAGENGVVQTSDTAGDFEDWISSQSVPPGQDGENDDPNHDGISNLMAYALGIPALGPTSATDHAAALRVVSPAPEGVPMRLHLRASPQPRADLVYCIDTSVSLSDQPGPGAWTEMLRHDPGQECPTGSLTSRTANFFGDETQFNGEITIDCPPVPPQIPEETKHLFARLRVERKR